MTCFNKVFYRKRLTYANLKVILNCRISFISSATVDGNTNEEFWSLKMYCDNKFYTFW